MPIIFPIAVYCLLVLLVRDLRSTGWRSAMITAAILWGATLAVITELLSVPRWLTRTGVSVAWLCVLVILLGARLWYRRSGFETSPNAMPLPTLPKDTGSRVLIGGLILLTLIVGITAVVSPPNTWDAMDYHLPRVIQWIGNHGVQPFPTPDYAQLVHPPWAEYAMLHFTLLWGNDRFVNIVQWASLIGSILCISLIAKQLGAGPLGQTLAAVICATIPEGVLEASGAKNTYVTAFWVAAVVYLLLRWKDESDWFATITTGLAIGLAVLTKGLAYLLLPSFFVLGLLWAPKARILWLRRAAVIGLIAIALNAPQFARNYRLTGSPIGQPVPENGPRMSFAVDRISFTGACANLLRNISLHVGGPFGRWNALMQDVFVKAVRRLGTDPNDPETTWRGFSINPTTRHEIHAGNPLHFALLAVAIVFVFLCSYRLPTPRGAVLYAIGVVGAFFLISTLLKWNQWSSRYHLPVFVLGAVLPAIALEKFASAKVRFGVAAILMMYALPLALLNFLRPLAPWSPSSILYRPRAELYFTDVHEYLIPSFTDAARAVRAEPCAEVGVDLSLELYVYPLFALMEADQGRRTVYITGVSNPSNVYNRHSNPCVVVCLGCANIHRKWAQYASVGGRASVFGDIVVFGSNESQENREALPQATDPRTPSELLAQADSELSMIDAIDLSPIFQLADRAQRDWPARKAELETRRQMLAALRSRAQSLSESLAPQRRRAKAGLSTPSDYAALLTSVEALGAWREEILAGDGELHRFVTRIYGRS